MLARRLLGGGAAPVAAQRLPVLGSTHGANEMQTRQAASLKAVKGRMKSVQNLIKITKAMKMVAASKLKHDQRRMQVGAPFCKPTLDLFARLPRTETSGAITYMGLSSDKGLCGGVNSAVSKHVRYGLQDEEAKGNSVKLMIIGLKGVGALKRVYGDRLTHSFEGVTKVPWSFGAASIIADRIISTNPGRLKVVSNEYKSMVAYDTITQHCVTTKEQQTMDKSEWSKAMDVYSFEPSIFEVWADLHEFYYGSVIYGAYLQGATAEQSARMTAMENASKNAGEMLDKLSLMYNRARQAKITTELCEIISGASAV